MTLQPFTNEQLNYFKFAVVVVNEFPKVLRQTFKNRWDNTFGHLLGFQPWDDSIAVRNMFLATEGGKTKVPTHLSYDEWDCTALFQAIIFARSFALPDSTGHHRTLSDLYVKPHRLHGNFHASVVSRGGNNAETFAMAIDQLRLLRNAFCHSSSSSIDKRTFDQYIKHTKEAIQALGLTSGPVDAVGSLTGAAFPTERVRQLEDDIRKELQAESAFLKEDVKDELIGIRSDIAQSNQERQQDVNRARRERKEETHELKKQLELHQEEWKEETLEFKRTRDKNVEKTTAANQEMSENIAELNRKFDDVLNNKKSARETKEEIHELKNQLEFHQEEWKEETLESRRTTDRNMETITAANQEMSENIAELNRKFDDVLNNKKSARETKEEIHELKNQLEFHQEEWKEETLESRRTTDRNMETINRS
ncbi:hypothetical protein OS493_035203 [Desmophyllum pertusum]|uniref:DZIP3-like HEPN domain-containing protein n=1 Tax=Desmophyllum pertusum TaxID=174260 RepID=A0A9W9ZVY9_9CNID|nr:hypothetical protein OS493_035203 [Desmophyllum pertusum]